MRRAIDGRMRNSCESCSSRSATECSGLGGLDPPGRRVATIDWSLSYCNTKELHGASALADAEIAVPEEGLETLFGAYDENLKQLEALF